MGAAPDREREGETREGKQSAALLYSRLIFSTFAWTCVKSSLYKLLTASEEKQTDGDRHAVRDNSTNAHQTQIPRHDHPK